MIFFQNIIASYIGGEGGGGHLREVQKTAPRSGKHLMADRSITDCRLSLELVWREPIVFNLIENGKEVLGNHVFD